MKTCRKCGERKPFEEFAWRRDRGRDSYCRACARSAVKATPARVTKDWRAQNAYQAAEKRLELAHPQIYRKAYKDNKARLVQEGNLANKYLAPYAQSAAHSVLRGRFSEEFTSLYAEEKAKRGLPAPRALQGA